MEIIKGDFGTEAICPGCGQTVFWNGFSWSEVSTDGSKKHCDEGHPVCLALFQMYTNIDPQTFLVDEIVERTIESLNKL
jgi:hypothetical protein